MRILLFGLLCLLVTCTTEHDAEFLENFHQRDISRDVYPGLINFKRVASQDEKMTISGTKFLVYGEPNNYKFQYDDFTNRNLNCGQDISPRISNSLCYVNDFNFTWEKCSDEGQICYLKKKCYCTIGMNKRLRYKNDG